MRPTFALLLLCLLDVTTSAPVWAGQGRASGAAPGQVMVMLPMPPAHFRTGSSYSGGYGDDAARGARQRAATRIARDYGLSIETSWPMPTLAVECFIMAVPDDQELAKVAERIGRDKAVKWSEPVADYTAQTQKESAEDMLYKMQPAASEWPLASLHRSLSGRNVTVAVIDSGVDTNHPDLIGQIALSRNFAASPYVGEDHGTAVAGVIAARANDRVGIAGIAPGARVMALRACTQADRTTSCDSFSLAKAIQFALERRAPIINLSLSGPPGRLLTDLLKQCLDHGSAVVAAVDPDRGDGGFPASLPGVIAVRGAGFGRSLILAYSAPAQDIPVPQPGKKWALVNGTSYAAAHVSGLLALLRQAQGGDAPLKLAPASGGPINMCATFGKWVCAASVSKR